MQGGRIRIHGLPVLFDQNEAMADLRYVNQNDRSLILSSHWLSDLAEDETSLLRFAVRWNIFRTRHLPAVRRLSFRAGVEKHRRSGASIRALAPSHHCPDQILMVRKARP